MDSLAPPRWLVYGLELVLGAVAGYAIFEEILGAAIGAFLMFVLLITDHLYGPGSYNAP